MRLLCNQLRLVPHDRRRNLLTVHISNYHIIYLLHLQQQHIKTHSNRLQQLQRQSDEHKSQRSVAQ